MTAYNEVVDKLKDTTRYNAENEERGILMGDPAVVMRRPARNK